MADVSFPTKRIPRGPRSTVVQVVDVQETHMANYGPQGRDGILISLRYQSTGTVRAAFFPVPPARRTDKLFEALEELGIDLDGIGGWTGLIDYWFRWANEDVQVTFNDRDTKEPRTVTVTLEYPIEVVVDEKNSSNTNGRKEIAEASATVASPAKTSIDQEAFLDAVCKIISSTDDGITLRELRMKAAEVETIRQAEPKLKEMLSRGQATDLLKQQGRIVEKDDGVFVLSV